MRGVKCLFRTWWLQWAVATLMVATALVPAPAWSAASTPAAGMRHCWPSPVGPKGPQPVDGEPFCVSAETFNADVCAAIDRLAAEHDLPAGFFARLIWQESRFDPNAVSPAGAEGIAQFIPSTARRRALSDPFNPAEALARSALYLGEMTREFGNLGLAAIGYNAGEERARRFRTGDPFMPGETRHYVHTITGHPVEAWQNSAPDDVNFSLDDKKPFLDACVAMAASRKSSPLVKQASWKPWGVQLGAAFSQATASRIFDRVRRQYDILAGEEPIYVSERNRSFGSRPRITVRIGRDTRAESQQLCARLRERGGFCLVVSN